MTVNLPHLVTVLTAPIRQISDAQLAVGLGLIGLALVIALVFGGRNP